jgi:hypothetical protein
MQGNNRKQRHEDVEAAVMTIVELQEQDRAMPPMRLTYHDVPVTQRITPEIGDKVLSVLYWITGTVVDYPIQGAPDGLTVQVEVEGKTRYLLWNTHTPKIAAVVWEGELSAKPDVDYAIIEAPVAVAYESALTTIFGVSMWIPSDAMRDLQWAR